MFDEPELLLNILILIKFVLFILLIIFACIYALPLCFLSRFRSPINIMTVHLCLTFIGSAIFWVIVYILDFDQSTGSDIITQQRCSILSSIETMFNCLVIYSLCTVSLNRFFSINYTNKILFKSRRWSFACIGITWLITLIVSSLILIPSITKTCSHIFGGTYTLQLYTLLIVVIFPAILFVIINILLFDFTRQSSRRIQPDIASARIILNNRDIRLLKHMIIMFIIFLSGWSPIYILVCFDIDGKISRIVYRFLSILPALSLLGDVIDLFLFNHQLRSYFRPLFVTRNNRIQPIVIRQ